MQKYSVNQHLIETLLAWVNSGEIAIPEIQRPFVWDSSKVQAQFVLILRPEKTWSPIIEA